MKMITSKSSKAVIENIKKQSRATSEIFFLLESEFYELVEKLSAVEERREIGLLNYDTAFNLIHDYKNDIEFITVLQKATIIFDFEDEVSNVSLSKSEIKGINKIMLLLDRKIREIRNEDDNQYLDFLMELRETNIYIDLNYLSSKTLSSSLKVSEFHGLNNDSLYEILFLCLKIIDYKTNRYLIRKAKFSDMRFSKEEYLSKMIFFLKECPPYRNPFGSLTDFANEIDEFLKSLSSKDY